MRSEGERERDEDAPWLMSHSASSASPFLTAMWRSVSRPSGPFFFGGGGVALGLGGGAALGAPFVVGPFAVVVAAPLPFLFLFVLALFFPPSSSSTLGLVVGPASTFSFSALSLLSRSLSSFSFSPGSTNPGKRSTSAAPTLSSHTPFLTAADLPALAAAKMADRVA